MTVVKLAKVLAPSGVNQIGALTSAGRGQLVTLCVGVSAAGQVISPFLIYPRVHFREHFLSGAPTGTRGPEHKFGWMTVD